MLAFLGVDGGCCLPPRTMTTADIDYVASFQAVLSHRRALRRLGFACYARSCCSQQRGAFSTIDAAPFRSFAIITTAVWGVQLRNWQSPLSLLASVFYAVFSASRRPTTCLREGYERFFDRWRPKLLTDFSYTRVFSHFYATTAVRLTRATTTSKPAQHALLHQHRSCSES